MENLDTLKSLIQNESIKRSIANEAYALLVLIIEELLAKVEALENA